MAVESIHPGAEARNAWEIKRRERSEIATRNNARRMRSKGEPLQPLPDLPPEPKRYEVLDDEGEYGFVVFAVTKAEAKGLAREHIEDNGHEGFTKPIRVRLFK